MAKRAPTSSKKVGKNKEHRGITMRVEVGDLVRVFGKPALVLVIKSRYDGFCRVMLPDGTIKQVSKQGLVKL